MLPNLFLGDTIETITIQSITDKSNKTEKATIARSRTLTNASIAQTLDIIKMELQGLYSWAKQTIVTTSSLNLIHQLLCVHIECLSSAHGSISSGLVDLAVRMECRECALPYALLLCLAIYPNIQFITLKFYSR